MRNIKGKLPCEFFFYASSFFAVSSFLLVFILSFFYSHFDNFTFRKVMQNNKVFSAKHKLCEQKWYLFFPFFALRNSLCFLLMFNRCLVFFFFSCTFVALLPHPKDQHLLLSVSLSVSLSPLSLSLTRALCGSNNVPICSLQR